MIANIRKATNEAAQQMKRNEDFANQGAQTIKDTEVNLQVIMNSFGEIISKNKALSSNQNEQLQAVKDVKNMMERIFTLSRRSKENTSNVLDNARSVENVSLELKMALTQFSYQ